MANSLQATITAPSGPGDLATAAVFTNARSITFNGGNGTCAIVDQTGKTFFFDCNLTTTITATASAGVFTFTVSQ